MFVRGREWDVTEERQFTGTWNRLGASSELKIPKSGFESLPRFLLVGGIQARQFAGPLYIRYSNRKDTTCQDRFLTKSKTHGWNGRSARASRPQSFECAKSSVAPLELREQPQHFKIEPDESDHQAERAVPLHVTRSAVARAGFDHVEVEHQVERGDDHNEEAEADADDAAAVDCGNRDVEEAQHHLYEIKERNATGSRDDAQLEILRGADRARFVGEEHHGEHAEGQPDGVKRDAGIGLVELGRNTAEE